jgi:putative transposase
MKLEVLEKGYYYHIYNRGINGTTMFENDSNKLYFLKQLAKYSFDKISIFAYCLMNNHFHLVIRLNAEEKEVTQAFSNLFNSYAKAFNKQVNRTGSLFEKHFK